MDTGATGSMINVLCQVIGLQVYPSQADGDSSLGVVGEIHTTILTISYITLPLHDVVVRKLKVGLLVGMSLTRENKIVIDLPKNSIMVDGSNVVHFNNQIGNQKVSHVRTEFNNITITWFERATWFFDSPRNSPRSLLSAQGEVEDPNSNKCVGTNSPCKGMYVYNVAPMMGLKNMTEYLEELVSHVWVISWQPMYLQKSQMT